MNEKEKALDEQMRRFYGTSKSVQQVMFEYIANGRWRDKYPTFLNEVEFYIRTCNSPIELSLAIAFIQRVLVKHKDKEYLFLEPQAEIIAGEHTYFVDFLFDPKSLNNKSKIDYKLVIECDGHDYHHATKQQVKSDYERETNLKLAGYDVLRFTGSQIYGDPYKCVDTIIDYILKKVGDADA